MKINWAEWEAKPSCRSLGHGIQIHDTTLRGWDESLIAFVDGFRWLHGQSDEATVYVIKPDPATPDDILKAMRLHVEELIAKGKIPNGKLTDRTVARVNG